MQNTQIPPNGIYLFTPRKRLEIPNRELVNFIVFCLLTFATYGSLQAETTVTQRGTPSYQPAGVVMTSLPIRNSGQPAWGNQIFANTVDLLGDTHQTASDACWLCPNTPHDGPYDRELREAVATQGQISTDVFLAEEASFGSSLFKGLVFVPAEGHQLIPRDIFPIHVTGQLLKDGRPKSNFSYQLDRSYQVELTHLPDLSYIGPSANEDAADAPGAYEWRKTYRDTNGNGWKVVEAFTVVADPTDVTGDLNYNGRLDLHDINILTQNLAVGATNLKLDINKDETVNSGDIHHWVTELKSTRIGDTNLDGAVKFDDFLTLSDNYGQSEGWGKGDFDGNGDIDFSDFLALSANFGLAGTTSAAAVPEPNDASLALFGILGLIGFRKRR